ncbi:MAG: biotin--[acetyl-CoA-carboxylase] ligase [Bacteriovoracaceae bacterium]|nr:biotin--[acetyl-CoA-carboxylase] ligase [Bacteriovoracaceae bacterium]
MYQKHLVNCDSTQIYLKENITELLKKDTYILVSTNNQIHGIGRHGNTWKDYPNALAFSFLLYPTVPITLIPIILGIQLSKYIELKFNEHIRLKWPNDLMNTNMEKCAGILCQYYSQDIIIVGIGLDLGKSDEQTFQGKFNAKPGVIKPELKLDEMEKKELPKDIYQYILENPIDQTLIKQEWEKLCAHMGAKVEIEIPTEKKQGIFRGISKKGTAIIETSKDKFEEFISGSLNISDN